MSRYSLTHLSDGTLLQNLHLLHRREDSNTADILAHIAEVDERRLFAPAGYPSMSAYCVGELHRSEDAAAKRIQAARVARKFPIIFELVADARLHLSGVCLLAPRLTEANPHELIAAAIHLTKSQIENLLAERFPKPNVSERVHAITTSCAGAQHAPGHVEGVGEPVTRHVETELELSVGPEEVRAPRDRMSPLGAGRFAIQATISEEAESNLRRARALLGHQAPAGELGRVLGLAFKAPVERLEKRKFAATSKARPARRANGQRCVPAHVRRAVVARDGGQCTFVSDGGRRCEARANLEYDHVVPVARGGEATVSNIRLLCRTHNQYEAERAYGPAFMNGKREAAAEARAAASPLPAVESRSEAATSAASAGRATLSSVADAVMNDDVIPYLRKLGYKVADAREAAARCESVAAAPLERRVRAAIAWLGQAGC